MFLRFVNNENVDEDLINRTVEFYEHWWLKTSSFYLTEKFHIFYPQLQLDCVMQLFYPAVKDIPLFEGADIGFFRLLLPLLRKTAFKKDNTIIRCNDVQPKIYILIKGEIDITVANTKLCTLTQGGMFGNLSNKPRMRQKIKASTFIHSEVLSCQAVVFMRIINQFPKIKQKLDQFLYLSQEYIT